jgi:hypothetical protein
MDKVTKKRAVRIYDMKRALAIKETAAALSVTEPYVRNVLNGFSSYGRADEIKAAFNKRYNEIKQLLNQNQ